MEQGNRKNIVIILFVVIIAVLAFLCVLFATGTINLKSKEVTTNNSLQTTENVLTNDEAMNIVKMVMKKSFNFIYAVTPECGDRNTSDSFQEGYHVYEASASYKTQEELEAYLHTFLSDSIISSVEEKYIVDMYKEKDNKLYCLNSGKDCEWIYGDDDTNYTIGSITSNEIKAGGNIYYETCGNEKKEKPVSFVLKRDSKGNWILDTFDEK